jgi:hypothetical protein
MREVTFKYYTFDELSGKAKEKAIAACQKWYDYCDDLEFHEDDLIEAGFKHPKIWYSGFYIQGEGACFDAEIDTDSFLIGKYEALKEVDFTMTIMKIRSCHYSHEITRAVCANFGLETTEDQEALIAELEAEIEELRLNMCIKIYQSLRADYFYQMEDSSIGEYLESGDFEFLEDGTQV